MEQIYILFKEQPDDIRYVQGTYTKMTEKKAEPFLESGMAVKYDPDTGEEITDEDQSDDEDKSTDYTVKEAVEMMKDMDQQEISEFISDNEDRITITEYQDE